jgi:hypothetical protein
VKFKARKGASGTGKTLWPSIQIHQLYQEALDYGRDSVKGIDAKGVTHNPQATVALHPVVVEPRIG